MKFFPAPDDYTSTEQTITSFFISPETVSIPIVLDSIEEQNETFTVRLIPAPGENLGDILISPDTATVTIVGKYLRGQHLLWSRVVAKANRGGGGGGQPPMMKIACLLLKRCCEVFFFLFNQYSSSGIQLISSTCCNFGHSFYD